MTGLSNAKDEVEKGPSALLTFWRRYKRRPTAVIGLGVLIVVFLVAILAPLISPYDFGRSNIANRFAPPSWEHLLGTDVLGRDILSGIMIGARASLFAGFAAAGLAAVIGTALGAVAGYYGGILDSLLMRTSDLFLLMPSYFLWILIITMFRTRSILLIGLMLGITMWPRLSRVVRASFLTLKETDFVRSAKALGANDRRVIFRHILPNALAPIIVVTTFNVAVAILIEASLSYLGFGDPNMYSWGYMLTRGQETIRYAWWQATFPGLAIFLTTLAFNFVGDGLRDALDPRLR